MILALWRLFGDVGFPLASSYFPSHSIDLLLFSAYFDSWLFFFANFMHHFEVLLIFYSFRGWILCHHQSHHLLHLLIKNLGLLASSLSLCIKRQFVQTSFKGYPSLMFNDFMVSQLDAPLALIIIDMFLLWQPNLDIIPKFFC